MPELSLSDITICYTVYRVSTHPSKSLKVLDFCLSNALHCNRLSFRLPFLAMSVVRCPMFDVRQWAWSPLTTNKSLTYLLTYFLLQENYFYREQKWDLNPRPLAYESKTLTTRPTDQWWVRVLMKAVCSTAANSSTLQLHRAANSPDFC